jgi:hypothetical protein
MKLSLKSSWDYYAQVLLELICETCLLVCSSLHLIFMDPAAIKMNHDLDIDPQPPVYALLADTTNFYFLSYDGIKFQFKAAAAVPQHSRAEFMQGMVSSMFCTVIVPS